MTQSYPDLIVTNSLTIGTGSVATLITSVSGETGPTLNLPGSLITGNDLSVNGAIGSATQVNHTAGGGAVIIGHGWTDPGDYPAIVLTDYPNGGTNNTLWLKYNSGFPGDLENNGGLQNCAWGNLKLATLLVSPTFPDWNAFQGWSIAMDIQSACGAIQNLAGNILFGLDYDGNFYWASIDEDIYTMVLDHSGSLYLSYGTLYSYDEYDDLAIVKGIKTKSISQNGKTKQVIDPSSLSLVNPDANSNAKSRMSTMDLTNYYAVGKTQGLALCCLKNVAIKLDTYDTNYDALLSRVQTLENELKARNTAA